jgi:hypothetical protein
MQHVLRCNEHRFAFAGKAAIRTRSLDDSDTEFIFEGAQRVGQRRLGDVAFPSCPSEMPVLVERYEVAHGGE